jgi:hypothetical protein
MKRKGRSHLPKVRTDGWPQPDDINGPVFGQFPLEWLLPRWRTRKIRMVLAPGSPSRTGDGWRWGFDILRVFAPVIIWLVLIVLVITALLKLV